MANLQNITWLSEKVRAVYIKEKDVFTFWKGKCIKTGIMTNAGKNRLVSKSHLYKHSQNKRCMCKQFW